MKLSVSTDCQGHGLCYMTAPDLFEDDDEGYSHPTGDGEVAPDDVDLARRAVANCPEKAISLDGETA